MKGKCMSVKKMVKDAHKFADQLIEEQNNQSKFVKSMARIMAWSSIPVVTINRGWLLTIILVASQFFVSTANAACTYRVNSLGTTVYSCDGGQNGTLRTDSLGTMTDSVTGTRYRTDSLGTTRGSDGSSYRTDSLGTIRGNDGSSWRKDSLGTWRSNTGTTCRTNSLGTMRCD